MPNVEIWGNANAGKTLTMVAFFMRLCILHGYKPEEACGNLRLNIDGYTYMPNPELRKYIHQIYRVEREDTWHRIILVDEIDGLYSHLDWMDKTQQADLKFLWQDFKKMNYMIWTKHRGIGINKIIRDATIAAMKPYMDREHDIMRVAIGNADIEQKFLWTFKPSNFYDLYNRAEVVY